MIHAAARARTPNGGVLVVHPGKQHAYEVAIALQRAGRLREFVTGMYFKPSAFPYSLFPYLPETIRLRFVREATKRIAPALSPELIRSWPYAEMLSRTLGRIRWIQRLSGGWSGYPFVNWAADHYVSRLVAGMHPRPEAVYAFLGAAEDTFSRARRLGIRTVLDVPIVLDVLETLRHEYQVLGLGDPVISAVSERRIRAEVALADWVVTPSSAVAASVRRAGFAGRGLFVVPFGVDPSVFKPAPDSPEPGRFRVVFAGRIEVRKGVHHLLKAWREAGLDGELILAGSPGEEEFIALIRRQYRGVFAEAGNLSQRELAALFSTADVFVLPSLAEGSALVTYQALASGVPCIVTAESGSVVRDGVEGFVIPARDSRALMERLSMLHRDVDLRQRMARAALARGREFTWDRYHRELASAIAVVLERDQPGFGGAHREGFSVE